MKPHFLPGRALLSLIWLSLFSYQVHADTLDAWSLRNPFPAANGHFKIDYLNGQFVVYSGGAGLATSPDATNWTGVPLPFDGTVKRIAYGIGRYVAVGSGPNGGLLASSPDLSNWTPSDSGTG